MWLDVIDLRNFYETRLGIVVRRLLRNKIRELWPNVQRQDMMAVGYPTPFLRHYRTEARRLVAFMPAEQGALSWSSKTPNIVVLTEETQLPLPDKSVDLALIVHALEFTSDPQGLIKEAWRVLADGGRMLIIVPNRVGIWARLEKTPLGHGHPYSLAQLNSLLKECRFTPERVEHALFIPPTQSRVLLSLAKAWEKIGNRWFRHLSGVLVVEASKQLYAKSGVKEVAWKEKIALGKKLALPVKHSQLKD